MTIQILKEKKYVRVNAKEKYTGTDKCSTNNCSNTCNLTNRRYKSYVRVPLKGYRKTVQCSNQNDDYRCYSYQQVFRDTYSNASNILCASNSTSGNYSRTNRPLVKSGMMPNKAGTAKSDIKNKYAYSYHERIKNLKQTSYERNLPKNSTKSSIKCIDGTKNNCAGDGNGPIIHNYNNKHFFQQGAVSCSSRLERLKLNAKMKHNKCNDTNNDCNSKCCYDKKMFVDRIVGPKDIYGESGECNINPKVYSNALFKVRGSGNNSC